MNETALTRAARALDLIPFIMEHDGLSVEELAQEFHTTPKEITKDLNMLFVCGLPGYTPLELIDLSFESGYVSVIQPQTLDRPRKLTRREVLSLILSLDGLAKLRDPQDPLLKEILGLRNRLAIAVKSTDLNIASNQMAFPPSPFLTLIESSITTHGKIQIDYISGNRDEISQRVIRPSRLYLENGMVYLEGYCYLAHAERTFRLDRVTSCSLLDPSAANDKEFEFVTDQTVVGATDLDHELPILEISAQARNFLEENAAVLQVLSATPEITVVQTSIVNPEWLIRAMLGYGSAIRVVSPDSLVESLKNRAAQALAYYQE
ncbi:MAG: WYL domain-containing protein [Actinomycetes bacterium]